MALDRELLGLAGEFLIASELCRRGLYVQLTLGRHKRADLLLESESAMSRIQVKAKQQREWPGVQGVSRPGDFLVLVDFASKSLEEAPDLYLLDAGDWMSLVRKRAAETPGLQSDSQHRVSHPDGWQGLNLRVEDVVGREMDWERITRLHSPGTSPGAPASP